MSLPGYQSHSIKDMLGHPKKWKPNMESAPPIGLFSVMKSGYVSLESSGIRGVVSSLWHYWWDLCEVGPGGGG